MMEKKRSGEKEGRTCWQELGVKKDGKEKLWNPETFLTLNMGTVTMCMFY